MRSPTLITVVAAASAWTFVAGTAADTPEVWRPFSNDSPWNQPIGAEVPSDPNSDQLIADLASRGPWQINIRDWSIPVYFVDASTTPRRDVGDLRPGIYGRGFEFPRHIPIPDGAVASPPVGDDSDNHLCIIDRTRHLEWGMWAARQDPTGRWFTGLGAVTDLSGTGVAPPWFDSPRQLDSHRARASGFPLIAGLIRVEEIKAGHIDHALVFAYDHCRPEFLIPPASTAQVNSFPQLDPARGIPMGGRIQLDPAWDVEHSGLSPSGKIIARALQEYGAYCGDYAGANVLYAENSPAAVAAWQGLLRKDELTAIFNPAMIAKHFRVIRMGNLLPGQNLSVAPPYVISFAVAGERAPARIDQLSRTVTVFPAADATSASVVCTWKTYPSDTRVTVDQRSSVSGKSALDLRSGSATALRLDSPEGSPDTWTVTIGKD